MACNCDVKGETKMKLRKYKFKAWLESFKPNQIVGESEDGHICPIANYLKSEGYELPFVESTYYADESTRNPGAQCPIWARKFVQHVDSSADYDNVNGNKVKAKTALEILEMKEDPYN